MDRAQKLGRLQRLRRSVPHVSASALAAVLAEVERDGVPELRSRKHMMEATEAEILVDGPYGKLITEIELIGCRGQTVRAIVANPLALLCRAFEQGGAFTELVLRCHRSQPSTPEAPWTLILYGDEVVPGNQLSFANLRKMWVLYYSLLELGAIALQSEDAWLILTALRSSLVSGHTACIKRYSLTSPQNNYIRWVTLMGDFAHRRTCPRSARCLVALARYTQPRSSCSLVPKPQTLPLAACGCGILKDNQAFGSSLISG